MTESSSPSAFWQAVKNNVKLQRRLPAISLANRSQTLPLSLGQERLWQLEQLQMHNSVHNLRAAFRLQGRLNIAILEKSIKSIVQRHEILRTEFPARGQKPSQFILPEMFVELPLIDLSAFSSEEQQRAIINYAQQENQTQFDLDTLPLFKVKLLRLSDAEHILLRATHHIVYDLWSDSIFMRELAKLYEDFLANLPSSLPELPIQYVDYAVFQRQQLNIAELLTYWQQQLKGSLPLLQLPVDYQGSFGYQGETEYVQLPKALQFALQTFARQQGSSLFGVLLTGFNALLYQYSQQQDMLLCSPIAGRYQVETKKLIGFFNNLLLLRSDLSQNPNLIELLQRINQMCLAAQNHQDLPLQALSEQLTIPANLLSRMMFTLQNVPVMPEYLADIKISRLDIEEGIANFDLSLSIRENTQGLLLIARYKTDLFTRQTINELLQRYLIVLNYFLTEPEIKLDKLPHFGLKTIQIIANPYIAPTTEMEKLMAKMWQEVLQLPPIGLYEDFFAIGGSSLSMLHLHVLLEKRLQKNYPIVDLFKQPTISGMAHYLTHANTATEIGLDVEAVRHRADRRRQALNQQKHLKTRRLHND